MPLSELDRLLLEEKPKEEGLSGLDQMLLGVPEEAPPKERTWWEEAWGTVTEAPSNIKEAFLKLDEYTYYEPLDVSKWLPKISGALGSTWTWAVRILPGNEDLPPWPDQTFKQKLWVATQATAMVGAVTEAIRQGISVPKAIRASGRMKRIAKMPTTRAEALKEAGKKVEITRGFAVKEPEVRLKPIKPAAGAPSITREVTAELHAIKPAILKTVKTLQFKDTIHKQLYDLVSKYKPSPTSVDMEPFYKTADALTGTPLKGLINPAYGEVTYNQINKVLPFMLNQLVTSGKATAQIKEVTPEERIVEEQIPKERPGKITEKELDEIVKWGEKEELVEPTPEVVVPEVAPKAETAAEEAARHAKMTTEEVMAELGEGVDDIQAEAQLEAEAMAAGVPKAEIPAKAIESELQGMLVETQRGEPGKRIKTDGDWVSQPSTYPKWMSEHHLTKKQVLEAFEKKKGGAWTELQGIARERVEYGYETPELGRVPSYMEQEINAGGGPVLGMGIELTDKQLFTEPKEKNVLGKAVDAITKWTSVYTKVKKEYPEAYQMFREFKGGQELAWINAKQSNEELWGKITQDEALAIQRHRQNPEKYPLEKLAEKLIPVAGKVENAMETWKNEFITMGKMKVGWPQSYIEILDKEKEKLLGEIPLLKQQKAIERRQGRITEIDDLVGMLKTRRFFPGRYLNTPEGQAALLKFLPEGRFRGSQIREKWIKGKTIADIDAAIEAGLEPLDPRAAMLDYLYWAETEKNKWVLYQGLKADPNLVMLEKDAPDWWDEATGLSELKGYKINPMIADVLREFEAPTHRVGIENAYRQVARTGKIASFYNPIIMGGIYDPQQGLAAAGVGVLKPWIYAKSIESISAKDEFYKQCVGADLFPKPVDLGPQRNMDQLILSAVKQMDESTPKFARMIEELTDGEWNFKGETNTKKMLKTIKGMYSAEWNLTWNLDAASRMTTVKTLMAKGWPFEKAVERARFYHADYGDIPGNTRRFLNYFMWTPSYQIAMGKVYANLARHPVKERGPLARIIAFQLLVATGMAIAGYSWERGNRFVKKERDVEDVIVNPGPLYWLNKNLARNPIQSLYWQSAVPIQILWSIDRNSDGLGGTVYDKKADQATQVAQIADFAIKRYFRPLEAAKRLNDTERSLLDRLLSLAAISKYQRKVKKKKLEGFWWKD